MSRIKKLNQITAARMSVIKDTVFDIFGGIETPALIGLTAPAGVGKTQTLGRLIADISLQEPVLVVLTENSPSRWKTIVMAKYLRDSLANPKNIEVIYPYDNKALFDAIENTDSRVICIDSFSGMFNEQTSRFAITQLRRYVEFKGKTIISTFQVRNSGNIAGGIGVDHNLDVEYQLNSFILKPQNVIYRKLLEPHGFEIGDEVKIIQPKFNKLRGTNKTLGILKISRSNPILEIIPLKYEDFNEAAANNDSNLEDIENKD